jgi:hypothetical protein
LGKKYEKAEERTMYKKRKLKDTRTRQSKNETYGTRRNTVNKNRVAEPEPAGAETFGWSRSRYTEVSAPAPAPGSGSREN